jgi:flagella basal body P-ring formation protein FlgA
MTTTQIAAFVRPCAVLIVVSWTTDLPAAEIRLRQQAQCAGAVVRLGDIADIVTPDKAERESLRAIELGPAGAGRQLLRLRDVQDRLQARGVPAHQHQFAGAATITVLPAADVQKESARPISKAAANLARTAAAEAIVAHLKENADADEDWTVELELTAEQARWISADRNAVAATGGEAPWMGEQKFVLTVPRGNRSTSFAVSADVKRSPRVVTAVNPISRGERIRAEDVELVRIKRGAPQRPTFQTIDEVAGKEAIRDIAAGQVLDAHYVRSPLLVKRGDVVDLFARAGGVQVRTRARAREEGGHGDLINIELLNDRRALVARVCGIQEVEVLASSPSVDQ